MGRPPYPSTCTTNATISAGPALAFSWSMAAWRALMTSSITAAICAAAILAGVMLGRRARLAPQRVLAASMVTLLACLALSRPLSLAVLWLTRPGHRIPAHVGLFGHTTLYPCVVAVV